MTITWVVEKQYPGANGCPCSCHATEGELCDPPFCCSKHWKLVEEQRIGCGVLSGGLDEG